MGHNGLSGLQSPWIWAECKIPLQATARLIDSLLTCDQKRKPRVDVGLRFLKMLRYNLQRLPGEQPGCPEVWSKASCRGTTTKLPSTWVESATMVQEECDAAGCQPAEPGNRTKGLFCFIVKMQCLL